MKIIDLGLQFIASRLALGNTPRYLGLHHSGGVNTVQAYHKMHQDNGWAGLGYNFIVDLDGTIYKGRDPKYVPAGILGHNQDSLHICAIGNFENMIMPDVQREALKGLVIYCKSLFPAIKEVKGHGELMATDCPGKNYQLQIMKDTFSKGLIQVVPLATAAPIQNKVFKLQHILNVMGILDASGHRLVEDGWMGVKTTEALTRIGIRRGDINLIVGWIQEQLGVAIDNIYGAAPWHGMYDALINYQKLKGLKVDGIAGVNTILKLAA